MAKWLITHPETKLDRQGRVHGDLDPPLSGAGKIQAKMLAIRFKNKGITKIHTSPRKRAVELAQAISRVTGAPVVVQDSLIPWRLGTMSGAKVGAIRSLLDFFSSRPNRSTPEGEPKISILHRYRRFREIVKDGEVIVGHSQHILADDYVTRGGDPAKVPMFGGKAGMVKEVR